MAREWESRVTKSKWLGVGLIVLGAIAVWLAVQSRSQPTPVDSQEYAPLVKVATVQQQSLAPQAVGYGVVSARQGWQMVAQISGVVTQKHPDLQAGFSLEAGELALQIDPQDYQLRYQQAKAEVEQLAAELKSSEQRRQNLNTSVQLEQQQLALLDKEVARRARLQSRGLGTDSDLDSQRRAQLSQRSVLSSLQQELALWPSEHAKIKAQWQNAQAQLQLSQRELNKTRWLLAQRVVVESVDVEQGQWVNAGQVLATGYQAGEMTLPVMIAERDAALLHASAAASPHTWQADVSWRQGSQTLHLPAEVRSLSAGVDSTTSMLTATLSVPSSTSAQLKKGQMVKATIEGAPVSVLTVPATALRGERVYRINDQNRVEAVAVKVLFRRGNTVAVEGQLNVGERLMAQDVLPLVAGMSVRVAADSSTELAQGEGL